MAVPDEPVTNGITEKPSTSLKAADVTDEFADALLLRLLKRLEGGLDLNKKSNEKEETKTNGEEKSKEDDKKVDDADKKDTDKKEDSKDEDGKKEKDKSEDGKEATKSRYDYKTSKYNDLTDEWETVTTKELEKPDDKTPKPPTDHAFKFEKRLQDNNKFSYSAITIYESNLRALLKKTLGKVYPSLFLGTEKLPSVLITDVLTFAHAWVELTSACEEPQDEDATAKQAREDLKVLLDNVRECPELKDYFRNRDDYLSTRVTTFEFAWTLFKPKSLVLSRNCIGDSPQILEVDSCRAPEDEKSKSFTFTAWCYDFDGRFVRRYVNFEIARFKGTQSIETFPCYPLAFFNDSKIVESLMKSLNMSEDVQKASGPATSIKLSIDSEKNKEILDKPYEERSAWLQKTVKELLFQRGKLFDRYVVTPEGTQLSPCLVRCNGSALSVDANAEFSKKDSDGGDDDSSSLILAGKSDKSNVVYKPTKIKENVILDATSYIEYWHSLPHIGTLKTTISSPDECSCSACVEQRRQEKENPDDDARKELLGATEHEERQMLLRACRLLGFRQKERTWAQFPIESISNITDEGRAERWNESLQLNEEYKDAILKLIENHRDPTDHSNSDKKSNPLKLLKLNDYAQDKGNGLVFMFYGPPGVGKTLTAELAAEATGKPLFSVGVGDIGLSADRIERNLRKLFDLAQRWKAILLIDEADVFLESREGQASNERNQMVAVMLRVLEYYSGIVILTTNRIPSVDVAVLSRIHLAICFSDLQDPESTAIWTTFLEQVGYKPDKRELNKLVTRDARAQVRLNGRQIRNVVSSALAWANQRAIDTGREAKLTWSDIETSYDILKDFQDNLAGEIIKARMRRQAGGQQK